MLGSETIKESTTLKQAKEAMADFEQAVAQAGDETNTAAQAIQPFADAAAKADEKIKVLKSGLDASQAAYGKNATTAAGLEDKLNGLSSVYDAQQAKVSALQKQLDVAAREYGDNSTEANRLRVALNQATAEMAGTENQIRETQEGLDTLADAQGVVSDETDTANMTLKDAQKVLADEEKAAQTAADSAEDLGDAQSEEGAEAEDATEKNTKLKDAMKALGEVSGKALVAGLQAAAAALAAVGAAAAGALSKGFEFSQAAGTYADDVATLAVQTGVSTQRLQEWSYASNFIDTSVDTITGSMTKMLSSLNSAADGNEAAQKKFTDLGIAINDFDGNLRSSEAIFWDAIDALGKIENPTERDAAAMELFGKSAKELNPLIEARHGGKWAKKPRPCAPSFRMRT